MSLLYGAEVDFAVGARCEHGQLAALAGMGAIKLTACHAVAKARSRPVHLAAAQSKITASSIAEELCRSSGWQRCGGRS